MNEVNPSRPLTVTVQEARRRSGLGNTSIYALLKEKKLESVTIGRRRLILYDSLERLLTRGAP